MKIAFTTAEATYLFHPDQIIYLEADNNYTKIHTVGNKPVIAAKVLSYYEDTLLELGFLRINRSYIVNPYHISRLSGLTVVMDDWKTIIIPKHSKSEFINSLSNHIKFT